ncbi:MAG: formyl transferase [Kiritimatiellia bacterium]|jgi:folate-dependent phosphoribosylglycinamide formyltransferase PurN|nr:formyl transferase [Kiritimatiellia bacterium]
MNWLILTTGNLPEAYVMADFLLGKSQEVAVVNIRGRTRRQQRKVLKRLAKKRGWLVVLDVLLGRLVRQWYLDPTIQPFPEITPAVAAELQDRCRYVEVADPHAPETLQEVTALHPDYILFLGAPVIRPELFSLAGRGAVNWHHGISPDYRGSDCVLWAMANNDFDQIGFTIHRVSAVVDGGGILLQRKVPVCPDVEFSEAVADIARQGLAGFVEVVERILSGQTLEAKEQEKGGRHYPPIGWSAMRRAARNYGRYGTS